MLEDIKKHYIWKDAISLSEALVELCEEFTDDTNVMVGHVRQSIMDIPASVAIDLKRGSEPTLEPLIRCAAQLELLRKIYPATDTDPAEEALHKIFNRIEDDTFFASSVSSVARSSNRVDSLANVSIREED